MGSVCVCGEEKREEKIIVRVGLRKHTHRNTTQHAYSVGQKREDKYSVLLGCVQTLCIDLSLFGPLFFVLYTRFAEFSDDIY